MPAVQITFISLFTKCLSRRNFQLFILGIIITIITGQQNNSYELSTSLVYDMEKLVCNTSYAVSFLKKSEFKVPDGIDYKFTIQCTYIDSCNESCEWSTFCSKQIYGNNVYVGGIHSLYEPSRQDRYLTILCCNGTLKNNVTTRYNGVDASGTCETVLETDDDTYELPGKNLQKTLSDQSKSYLFQETKAAHRVDEKPWIIIHLCSYKRDQNGTCPLVERDANLVSLAGLAGLAGLSGLGGLEFGPSQPLPKCVCANEVRNANCAGDPSPCDKSPSGFGCCDRGISQKICSPLCP